MSTEDDKELRKRLGEPLNLKEEDDDGCVPIYAGPINPPLSVYSDEPGEVWKIEESEEDILVNSRGLEKGFLRIRDNTPVYVEIDEPTCSECGGLVDARVLHANGGGKYPVYHCRCCKTVRKITHPELAGWLACTKLSSGTLLYVGLVEEGKVYRV